MLLALFVFLWLIQLNVFQHFHPSMQSILYFSMFSIIFLICIPFDFALIFITYLHLPMVARVYFSFSCSLGCDIVSFKIFFLMWVFVAINPSLRTVSAAPHISHVVHQYLSQGLFSLSFNDFLWFVMFNSSLYNLQVFVSFLKFF